MRILADAGKDATADVRVRVGSPVVVDVENPIVRVIVIVTTRIQHVTRSAEVPVIRQIRRTASG